MKIYNASGVEILDIQADDSSVRYRSIMADDSLTLQFSTTGPVTVPRGAYVDFEGARYTLFYPENFKKNSTRDFAYTLALHGDKEWLKFCLYRDRSAKPYRSKFKLTATPSEFIQLLIDNLSAKYGGGWSIGDCIEATETYLSFNIESCYDVLNRLAQEFSTEWEIIGKTIHFRKVEKFKDDPLPLSYGLGNGFKTGIGRQNDGDRQPVGQLDVAGGERNIDYSTYGSNTLLLPRSATLVYEGKTYRTDVDGMYITRDGNTNIGEAGFDGSKFYPKRVGTVSHVIVVDADSHFYDIRDTSIPAALNYRDCRIPGEKATIVFQSGALAGREFDLEQTEDDLTGYIHAERRFKIVPAELDGQIMPGGVFVPAVGDKYAIFNIRMPGAYISDDATQSGASWDMFREAVKYFAEEEQDKFSFTGELDGVWSRSRWLEIGGKIVPGGHVLFSDPQFQPDGVLIRITAIKDYVNKPHKPEITLSNAPVSGSFSSDLGKLEAEEVVREADKKDLIRYSKRQWRDAKETMSMLQEALLNFSGSINPLTVQTMQLLVGDESLQFRFVNSKTNPQPVTHNVAFNTTTKVLTAAAGIIQHMTIGITSMKKSHAASEYKYWDMSAYTSPALDPEKAYYLYARCATSGTTGVFLLSETAIGMESVANQYHFLFGILNSEQDGDRSFAPLYGYSEILPGRITTDRIVSQDGQTYFDLLDGIIGGRIKFLSSGSETDLETWTGNTETNIQEIASSTGGKMLYKDPTFKSGVNGTSRYNNAGGSTTFWERIAKPADAPTDSTHIMRYRYEGAPSSPNWGGFTFQTMSRANAVFVTKIVAKIPEGRQINNNQNAYGTGGVLTWLTPRNGTGKYETYIYKVTCGATGSFSSVNFFSFSGGSGAFNVEVAYATVFDMTLYDDTADQAKQDAAAAQSYAEAVMDNVADLDIYINNVFKDGVIDAAEAKAIEKYINSVNEIMSKAEASYTKVYANTYLSGTPKTNLLNAKVNLWGQRDTLLSAINTAISGGTTTPAQKTAVDNAFATFNSLMSAFQNAIEDANKAIQTAIENSSKSYTDGQVTDITKGVRFNAGNFVFNEGSPYQSVIGFDTNIPVDGNMWLLDINGFAYGVGTTFRMQILVYNYQGSIYTAGSGYTIEGGVSVTKVRAAYKNSKLSFEITTASAIYYLNLEVQVVATRITSSKSVASGWIKHNGFNESHTSIAELPRRKTLQDIAAESAAATAADALAKANTSKAITDNFTTIEGGLITSTMIQLRPSTDAPITAGMSAFQDGGDGVAFWAGGTYAQAIAGTAKAIIRHDGTSKFTDTEITGIINATSGSIGGFTIGSGRIGVTQSGDNPTNNGMALYNEFIKFSNSDVSVFLGTNVLPSTTGTTAMMRLTDSRTGWGNKYGAIISVSGANSIDGTNNNIALDILKGVTRGLRWQIKAINLTSNYSIGSETEVVAYLNASGRTVYLPYNPEVGEMKIITRVNNHNLTVSGNGKQILWRSVNVASSISFGPSHDIQETSICVRWDGTYWQLNGW